VRSLSIKKAKSQLLQNVMLQNVRLINSSLEPRSVTCIAGWEAPSMPQALFQMSTKVSGLQTVLRPRLEDVLKGQQVAIAEFWPVASKLQNSRTGLNKPSTHTSMLMFEEFFDCGCWLRSVKQESLAHFAIKMLQLFSLLFVFYTLGNYP